MINEKFAVFILSYGRADNVKTYATLRKCGYTGDIYIIVDDSDKDFDLYKSKYGDKVIIFNKESVRYKTDVMTPSKSTNAVVFARNECHSIAQKLGIDYFLELDDDYSSFEARRPVNGQLKTFKYKDLDVIFESMCEFLDVTGAKTVAMSQAGDLIGGKDNQNFKKQLVRKAMNSFFCKTDRPFKFLGLTNEDVNAYTLWGSMGDLFFTVAWSSLVQGETQQNKGGLTDIYLEDGTFVKSFYTVMCMPSAVKVKMMGTSHRRMHHGIKWNNCVPKIINEKWKKQR